MATTTIREKLIGALRAAIGQPQVDNTVQTLDSVQSLADQVNSLTGRPDAADTFLALQTKLKIKQLKSENTRGMYDKWIAQMEGNGLSARDSVEVLKNEVLKLQSEKLGHPAAAPTASAPRLTPVALPAPAQTLAAPVAPAAPTAPATPAPTYPLTAEYNALTDAQDKVAFYRQHKAQIDSEHRRQCREEEAVKPSKEPTSGGDIIAQLASIGDPASRTTFYRKNKAAIDMAYTKLNTKQ